MANIVKTNQLPVITDLTNAKVIGLDGAGNDAQFPLAGIVRSEKGLAIPTTNPSGIRFAGETWVVDTNYYGQTFTNFGNQLVPVLSSGHNVSNARFVWNAGAWVLQFELVDPAVDLTDYAKVDQSYIKGYKTPENQLIHSRGVSELVGNSTKTGPAIGLFMQTTTRVVFNRAVIPFYASADSVITVRFYKSATKTGDISTMTLLEEVLFAAGTFNQDSTKNQEIQLTDDRTILPNEYAYVLVVTTAGTNAVVKRWSAVGSSPARLRFYTYTTATGAFTATWTETSGGDYTPTFILSTVDPRILDNANKVAALASANIPDSSGSVYGSKFPGLQFAHIRGDNEIVGNTTYTNAAWYGMGFYEQMTRKALFNQIEINVYGGVTSAVTMRVYKKATFGTVNPSTMTLLEEVNYAAGTFPTTAGINKFRLAADYVIDKDYYLHVFFMVTAGTKISSGRWNVDSGTAPARHNWQHYDSAIDQWISNWANTVTGSGFYSTSFNLRYVGAVEKRVETLENSPISPGTITAIQGNVTTLQGQMLEITRDPRIVVPSKLYATAGFKANVYWESLVLWVDAGLRSPAGLIVSVLCDKGQPTDRFWRLDFTNSDAGSYPFTIKVYNPGNNLTYQKSGTLVIAANTQIATTKRVIFVGDSLTSPGKYVQSIKDNLTALGGTVPTFYGTQGTGAYKHEGYGGYGFNTFIVAGVVWYKFFVSGVTTDPIVGATYTNNSSTFKVEETNLSAGAGYINCSRTVGSNLPLASGTLTKASGTGDATITFTSYSTVSGNPFWNTGTSAVDIANYRTSLGLSPTQKFDLMSVMLGINDGDYVVLQTETQIQAIIARAKTLITAFLADNASTIVIVQLEPTCNSEYSGWSSARSRENYRTNIHRLHELMIANFDNGAFGANVRVGQARFVIDRYYGYDKTAREISPRYVGVTQDEHTNPVHPIDAGYLQLGDGMFSQIHQALLE